jgi:hypothetical protein
VLVSCVDCVAPVPLETTPVTFETSLGPLSYVGETHVLEAVVRDQMGAPISGTPTWIFMNEFCDRVVPYHELYPLSARTVFSPLDSFVGPAYSCASI